MVGHRNLLKNEIQSRRTVVLLNLKGNRPRLLAVRASDICKELPLDLANKNDKKRLDQMVCFLYFRWIYNLIHRRMFTSKVWTDDTCSRLLQESNFAARHSWALHHIIQAITSEGLAQGPCVAARGGVESATFRTKGTECHHSTNHAPQVSASQTVSLLAGWPTDWLNYSNEGQSNLFSD